jgi:DNA-binding CsgD family transcriptional regulator
MVCGSGAETLTSDTPVVMLSGRADMDHERRSDARIFAVLDRNGLTTSHLIEAVRATAVGLRIAPPVPVLSHLDPRDHEVLKLLAGGAATRDIAINLGYSERTVKETVAHLKRLLGAKTRAQLVAEALRLRLI